MAEFEHQRAIPAEPQVVFDVAADPPTLNSWTPDGVELEPAGPPGSAGADEVHARVESGSNVYDATGYVDVDRDDLRMEWGGDEDLYTGWLQVEPDEENGSVATLHLTFAGNQSETLGGEISEKTDLQVSQALDRLASLVADRAGGRTR